MKLSSSDINKLCEIAIEAAIQAGELINNYKNKQVLVHSKTGGSSYASQIVTEVDFKSQELILELLYESIEKYDLGLLTEESVDNKTRLNKDYFWCIDPLDGTLSFAESKYGYAVSIALVSTNGESIIGVVYDPVKQNLYHAKKNDGAYKNQKPWHLKPSIKNKPLSFYYNRSFKDLSIYQEVIKELEKIAEKISAKGIDVTQPSGAVMNACLALENTPSCYFTFPKSKDGGGSFWDYAATACIYKEIGASVSNIFGNALNLNEQDSSFMNKKGVLFASNNQISENVKQVYIKFKSRRD